MKFENNLKRIHIMKKNLITKILAGSLLTVAAISAQAKTVSFNVGFVTLADLDIVQSQALTFGQNLIGLTGTTCTMTVTNVATNAATAASVIIADNNDALAGAGCLDVAAGTNNLMGVYTITGAPGQAFNITVTSASNADFDFAPTGLVSTGNANSDTGVTVFANTPQSATLRAGTPFDAFLTVAGTITIGAADLSPNTPYSQTFDITATY